MFRSAANMGWYLEPAAQMDCHPRVLDFRWLTVFSLKSPYCLLGTANDGWHYGTAPWEPWTGSREAEAWPGSAERCLVGDRVLPDRQDAQSDEVTLVWQRPAQRQSAAAAPVAAQQPAVAQAQVAAVRMAAEEPIVVGTKGRDTKRQIGAGALPGRKVPGTAQALIAGKTAPHTARRTVEAALVGEMGVRSTARRTVRRRWPGKLARGRRIQQVGRQAERANARPEGQQ